MERVGEARPAALMQQQQQRLQVQVQQGMASLAPMRAASFAVEPFVAAANKPRAAGLPPTPPQAYSSGQRGGGDVCMEDSSTAAGTGAGLPPRKAAAHRRSRSDVPFGYFPPAGMGGHQQLLPQPKVEAGWGHHGDGNGSGGNDLFNAYMNMEGLDGLNSSPDDRHDDGDSRGSSIKADSSDNDSEECAADSRGAGIRGLWADGGDRREGVKRNAAGEPAAGPLSRHARSLSMDSLMGKLNFAAGAAAANGAGTMFSLEFGSGEFTPVEMKKIMADEKLAEMALADPKRVKRVLANRQSAARSKERKMRYIVELEQKVQMLQTEATTLSAQLTLLQRDSAGMAKQNNELRFRLQAMEQQAQLRDALNEALTGEVQRLKIATAELGDTCSSNGLAQQNQMFQLQQQATPIPFYQLQQQQQNGAANNHESRE